MGIAMLWFDNSKRSFQDKLADAIKYYEKKYGASANHCLVSLDIYQSLKNGDDDVLINGVLIEGHKNVRPVEFHISHIEER